MKNQPVKRVDNNRRLGPPGGNPADNSGLGTMGMDNIESTTTNKFGKFNNFDDIMNALHKVRAGLAKLRQISKLSKVVKANLDEDIRQVDYTIDAVRLAVAAVRGS